MKQCPFNPLLPEHMSEPWDLLAEARATCPVSEVFPGMVYVANYELASKVFLDSDNFSSEWLPAATIFGAGENVEEEMPFGMMDPPRHDPFRRLALEGLNARAVRAAEPWLADRCARFVDSFADRGTADLTAELASPLPVAGITYMLGVGEERTADVERWISAITQEVAVLQGLSGAEIIDNAKQEIADFHAFLEDEIAQRRAATAPADDVLSRMVAYAEPDGRRFSDLEIRTQTQFLLMAGHETTRELISNALYAVAADPELFARLRSEPEIAPKIVTETFRYFSPVQIIFRICVNETDLGGETIPAGTIVGIGIAAAGRDETTIDHADRFDIDQESTVKHLGLGVGRHYCVGATLSQLEATLALQTVAARFETLRTAPGFAYERRGGAITRGPRRLDVEFSVAGALVG